VFVSSVIVCPLDLFSFFFLDIMLQDSIIIFNSDKQNVVIEKWKQINRIEIKG
jgi:hypothetical protein